MFNRKSFVILLLVSVSIFSGCRTGLLGGEDVTVTSNQPAAPIVVDGVRASYADVVGNTAGAVVRIEAEGRSPQQPQQTFPFGDEFFRQDPGQGQNRRPQLQRGLGSGVIVSADGTILTNAHVIDGADTIKVLMADNRSFEAKLVGADKPSDLAVLKIESEKLPFLNLGNSDSVRVGDIVLAIGNPLGIGQSVTAGIISAKGRRTGLSDGQSFEDFLQTDAPINRGNSGGALVNLNSELIGINSQILSSPGAAGGNIGIGFAIPSNMAKSVMNQLLKDGRVRRGLLGIGIQNITDDAAQALGMKDKSGVLVNKVLPGSAAEKAGLKRGDIITAINNEKIEDSNVLRNKVAGTLPGTEITVTVLRDGSTQELTATLEEFATEEAANNAPRNEQNSEPESPNGRLGLSLQPVTPETAKQLGLTGDSGGLVVTDVDQNGVAAEAGIARGDVVLEINRQSVDSVEAVQSALNSAGGRPVLLLISRKGQTIYLTVRP